MNIYVSKIEKEILIPILTHYLKEKKPGTFEKGKIKDFIKKVKSGNKKD